MEENQHKQEEVIIKVEKFNVIDPTQYSNFNNTQDNSKYNQQEPLVEIIPNKDYWGSIKKANCCQRAYMFCCGTEICLNHFFDQAPEDQCYGSFGISIVYFFFYAYFFGILAITIVAFSLLTEHNNFGISRLGSMHVFTLFIGLMLCICYQVSVFAILVGVTCVTAIYYPINPLYIICNISKTNGRNS